jgi:hypothetical protein
MSGNLYYFEIILRCPSSAPFSARVQIPSDDRDISLFNLNIFKGNIDDLLTK